MEYKISLGYEGATDSALCINDKEYGVESRAWNLIAFAKAGTVVGNFQNYLKYIYDNFDEDLINKRVETTNEQPRRNKIIPNIEDCKGGHCGYGFPQFSPLREEELRNTLKKVLKSPETDYFHTAYKNSKELVEVYKRMLKLPFIEACELLYQTENSYIRYEMYMDKRGEIAIFHKCCR